MPAATGSAASSTLLLGARGMLGRAFAQLLDHEATPYTALGHAELDLTSTADIRAAFETPPKVVINCAAWTDVDGAEAHPREALAVNGDGVGALATACQAADALLLHFSTDYVFNGTATSPYPTNGPRDPVNAYGHSKAVGEELIEKSGCRYLIVRTSWLYAPWGKNFVRTIADLAVRRDHLRVVDDQRGRPSSAEHVARVSLELIRLALSAPAGAAPRPRGLSSKAILHVTDGGECTWFEFAQEIARRRAPACRVEPCSSAEFPRPARRPGYSVLDLAPTEALVGPMRDWRENLADVLARP